MSILVSRPAAELVLNINDIPNSSNMLGTSNPPHTLDSYMTFCCGGNVQNKAAWAQEGFESWFTVRFQSFRREDPKAFDVQSVAVTFTSASGASYDHQYAKRAAVLDPTVKALTLSDPIGDESAAFVQTPTTGPGLGQEAYIVFFRYRNVSDRVFMTGRIGTVNLAGVAALANTQLARHRT